MDTKAFFILPIFLIFVAACSKGGKAKQPLEPFSASQICKAGLAVMYHRDVSIMTSSIAEDGIRVQYKRSGTELPATYTCRLEKGQILTRDESLRGARWYGTNSDDSKLQFKISDAKLIVQDTGNGHVLSKKEFATNEIPD